MRLNNVELDKNGMVKELPDCAVEGCKEKGIVLLGTDFVCGGCLNRYNAKQNKAMIDSLKL